MNVTMMKLNSAGTRWRVENTDERGNIQGFTLHREGNETLATAAVRLEDLARKLAWGEIKPLSMVI